MSTYKELIKRASLTSDEKTDARSDFDDQKEWQEQLVAFALEETPNPEQLARYIKRKISKRASRSFSFSPLLSSALPLLILHCTHS